MSATDWQLDVGQRRATHRSGLVLVATPLAGNQVQVQPLQGTLPQTIGLSGPEQKRFEEVIGERVQQGGALLVEALFKARNFR